MGRAAMLAMNDEGVATSAWIATAAVATMPSVLAGPLAAVEVNGVHVAMALAARAAAAAATLSRPAQVELCLRMRFHQSDFATAAVRVLWRAACSGR